MKITINYSTYPYRIKKVLAGVLTAGSLLTAGFLFYAVHQTGINREEASNLQQRIDRLTREMEAQKSSKSRESDPKKLEKKIALVNEVIQKKSFSWTGFLNDLEKAIPKNISIKKIEPRYTDQSVNLSGEALTLKDLTLLILQLEGTPRFSHIFLLDQKQSKGDRIEFLVHLNYKEKGDNAGS